jgi:hypothetical protein
MSHAADAVVSYDQGVNPAVGYVNPSTALGPPERMTGDGLDPGVVSPFNPPWLPSEIVSIGRGGQLTVAFDAPVEDDPGNPYGIDLIIFGNTLLIDAGGGQCGSPCVVAGEGGFVDVSADGETWFTIPDRPADDFAPTLGFRDAAAYQSVPGRVPTDSALPVDPALAPAHLDGASIEDIDALYFGSAGGVGIDLATVGVTSISFVRVRNSMESQTTPEVDAIVDVVPRMPADVNFTGSVNIDDLLLVINDFGISPAGGPATDVTRNGTINIDDVLAVINGWTSP